jgi:hypothetical protein
LEKRREGIFVILQWATLVGIVGVVGSLLFAGWQTRMLAGQSRLKNNSALVDADQGPVSLLQTVLVQFVQYPELRPYFYDSKPLPVNEPELSRVKAMADLFADALYAGLHARLLLAGDGVNQAWCNYASDLLSTSPALRDLWTEHPDWWPQDLAEMLDISGCVQMPTAGAGKSGIDWQPTATP